jgi:hypothetical protein
VGVHGSIPESPPACTFVFSFLSNAGSHDGMNVWKRILRARRLAGGLDMGTSQGLI